MNVDAHATEGERWWDTVDALLDVTSYANTYFELPQRLAEAEAALQNAGDDEARQVAQCCLKRVRQYAHNIQQDLKSDGLAAPGTPGGTVVSVRLRLPEDFSRYLGAIIHIG